MRPALAFVSLLALGLAACGNPDTPAGRIADERHENFEKIGEAAKAVGDQLKETNPDIAKIQAAAATINGFAPQVAGWFPAGSGPDDGIKTDALQAIWQKPAEFKEAVDKFVVESAKFDAVAKAGDLAAIGPAMQALGGTCKGCHDKFRKPD